MKIVHCLFVLGALTMVAAGEKYTDHYDKVDLEGIMMNRRLLAMYINCLLNKGRCTYDGRVLRGHIKEALETRCAKCTDAQKRGSRIVIGHLINKEPEYWTALKAKYDPERKFTKHFEDELKTIKG